MVAVSGVTLCLHLLFFLFLFLIDDATSELWLYSGLGYIRVGSKVRQIVVSTLLYFV